MKTDHAHIFNQAHNAGLKAGLECSPTPMVVQQHANPLDDNSPVVKTYAPVMDGVCGFASVIVKPATCSFARWVKSQNIGRAHYYGGLNIPCHYFNQSLARKEAYCAAFANVLSSHGIKAYVDSRMD